MILIQVVPDTIYFVWQLQVQMHNFREYDIEKDAIILVALSVGKKPSTEMEGFCKWTSARVFFYYDYRSRTSYMSSIRPHILAQHFKEYNYGTFFYHDQDIIFIEKPELDQCEGGNYVAAMAHNYIGMEYLRKFKRYIMPSMAEIVGISPEVIEENDYSAGGAQYVITGVDSAWWSKVEDDCTAMFDYLTDITKNGLRKYKPDQRLDDPHIQVWCADMWSVYWNMLLSGKNVAHHPAIDFSWPWHKKKDARAIMHNAGVTLKNEYTSYYDVLDANGNSTGAEVIHYWADKKAVEIGGTIKEVSRVHFMFYKGHYLTKTAIGERFDFVPNDIVQRHYIDLIHKLGNMEKRSILGIFCTHNQIHPDLLRLTLNKVKEAAEATTLANVTIVTVSWYPIPGNPFKGHITPFQDLGHLNYILQLKQALAFEDRRDIVCILEHDMLYPKDYFDQVMSNWNYESKYGVCNNNYIGMNQTGYLDVVQRHQPFSLMSFATDFLKTLLDQKVNENIANIGKSDYYTKGFCCIEPDDKNLMQFIDFTDVNPAIHVNMNQLGAYKTGNEGKNHHFTAHAEVCYAKDSNGKTFRSDDWGDFRQYFTFNTATP